jgi:hypothetical protein
MHYSDNNLLLFAKGCVNAGDEFNKRISKKHLVNTLGWVTVTFSTFSFKRKLNQLEITLVKFSLLTKRLNMIKYIFYNSSSFFSFTQTPTRHQFLSSFVWLEVDLCFFAFVSNSKYYYFFVTLPVLRSTGNIKM